LYSCTTERLFQFLILLFPNLFWFKSILEIIDVEMDKDLWYLTVGKTPLERVHKLLSKLHSIRVSKDRGSHVSKQAEALLNNFVQQVESIFKNLSKTLKWQSFLMHDLILLTDIPLKVQKASVKLDLNKANTYTRFLFYVKFKKVKELNSKKIHPLKTH